MACPRWWDADDREEGIPRGGLHSPRVGRWPLVGREEALTDVVAPTRQEDGCLFYDLHVAADDPSKFLFHESWASNAHHEAHDRTPHIQRLRSRIKELSLPAAKTWWEKIV